MDGASCRRAPAAILAAYVLSSCFILTLEVVTTFPVTSEPSTLVEGQDVILTPGGLPVFGCCNWYREFIAESHQIFRYYPPLPLRPPKQWNGPGHTGRETAGEDCSLRISNLRPSDTGIYIVTKEDREIGTQRGEISIVVSEKLFIPDLWTLIPKHVVVRNTDATFYCSASFKYNVTVSWYKDDELITALPGVPNQNQTLTLESVTKKDAGRYRCVVRNLGFSVSSNSIKLRVKRGHPSPEMTVAIIIGCLAGAAVVGGLVYMMVQ